MPSAWWDGNPVLFQLSRIPRRNKVQPPAIHWMKWSWGNEVLLVIKQSRVVGTSLASPALSLHAKSQQNLQSLVGYVCRNLPLANAWQTVDSRNSGRRVLHSWAVSKVWFPALRAQIILACKLSSAALADLVRTRIIINGVTIKTASWILANSMIIFYFPMLHKLIFLTCKNVTWFNKAVFVSREDKCSH